MTTAVVTTGEHRQIYERNHIEIVESNDYIYIRPLKAFLKKQLVCFLVKLADKKHRRTK